LTGNRTSALPFVVDNWGRWLQWYLKGGLGIRRPSTKGTARRKLGRDTIISGGPMIGSKAQREGVKRSPTVSSPKSHREPKKIPRKENLRTCSGHRKGKEMTFSFWVQNQKSLGQAAEKRKQAPDKTKDWGSSRGGGRFCGKKGLHYHQRRRVLKT